LQEHGSRPSSPGPAGAAKAAPNALRTLDFPSGAADFSSMTSRRSFLTRCAVVGAGLIGGDLLSRGSGLLAATGSRLDPGDPEVPNEEVARILKDLFGDRPIRKGHLSLDMPLVAEDGRIVPVIIESDLPMTPDNYVKAVHLIVDHNPDPHLAAYHLTPAIGSVAIQTRIKMKRTTWVRAIIDTSAGDVWAAYAHVAVSLNGCG
jgi:sulfur-oxidizing protein SoxY